MYFDYFPGKNTAVSVGKLIGYNMEWVFTNVHMLASVVATDDRHWCSSRHNKPKQRGQIWTKFRLLGGQLFGDNKLSHQLVHIWWLSHRNRRDKSLQQQLPIWGALVSSWVRLLYLHLVKIQPQLTHIWARLHIFHINLRNGDGADLFNGGWTLANGVEWAGVAIVDKVGWVVVGARSTVILQYHHFISLTGCKSIHKEI